MPGALICSLYSRLKSKTKRHNIGIKKAIPKQNREKREVIYMFLKKHERGRLSPTIGLAMGALTVIGAVTVTNAARTLISRVKSKMSSLCTIGGCMPKPSSSDDEDQY